MSVASDTNEIVLDHDVDCDGCGHDHHHHEDFLAQDYHVDEAGTHMRMAPKVGRNEPCPCGSGKKFKKCCI